MKRDFSFRHQIFVGQIFLVKIQLRFRFLEILNWNLQIIRFLPIFNLRLLSVGKWDWQFVHPYGSWFSKPNKFSKFSGLDLPLNHTNVFKVYASGMRKVETHIYTISFVFGLNFLLLNKFIIFTGH